MVAHKSLPPQEYLLAIFNDEGDTVSWKIKKAGIVNIGDKAKKLLNGYLAVQVDGRLLLVHRVLFKMRHGYEPPVIDHADGNKLNNADTNLRPCTVQQNSWNAKGRKGSKTGVKNVALCGRTGLYVVRFQIGRKSFYGGKHKDLEVAAASADALRKKLHGQFANGGSDV